jgi:hypothetical protein
MFHNFTIIDVAGTVEATLFMGLILYVPGYVIGWLSDAFSFRKQRFLFQSLLSTPLAISLLPIFVYFLGRYRAVLWSLLATTCLAFPICFRGIWKRWLRVARPGLPRATWIGIGVAGLWMLIVIASLVDLQIKDKLYFSVPAFDYSLRVSLTAASTRAIPPMNPFFAGNHPFLLRYHYFWMLICSLVPQLGSVGSRQAMYGGTVWAGIALMSLIGLSLKLFLKVRERFGRKLLIGCGLLLVTGLDILPTIFLYFSRHVVYPDMEWWNEQLTSWPDALLWCPHHVMSLVACFTGFLLLRQPIATKFQRVVSLVLAGMAFASAVGLSVLASFTFAVFIALWLPYAVLHRWWDELAYLFVAGCVGLVIALPFLRLLVGPAVDGASGDGRFFAVWIRPFPLGLIMVGSALKLRGPILGVLSVPFLPLNYFLELGFFALIGALRLRGIRKRSIPVTPEEAAAWIMVAAAFLIGTFLRSTTIQSNDLAWRCFLLAQFVLLLWAACFIDEWWSVWRNGGIVHMNTVRFAAVLLVLGAIGTIYQLLMLRVYPILLDRGEVTALESATWMPADHHLGERTYALRSVYDHLSADLPKSAIVQYNPDGNTYVPHGLYLLRGVAAGDSLCLAGFGGDATQCKRRVDSIAPLFTLSSAGDSASVDYICREYGISVILAEDNDPVWKQTDSWAWTRTPIISNQYARAFDCGDFSQQAKLGGKVALR